MKFIGKTRSVQELAVHILEPERTGSTRYIICKHSPNRRAKANAIVVSNLTPQYRGNHWKQTKISPKTRRPEERSFPKETRRFKNREAVIPILLILSLFWFPLLCTGASLFFPSCVKQDCTNMYTLEGGDFGFDKTVVNRIR